MIHPLQEDLSHLKDSEIETKIQDLTKKYHTAYKLGKIDILTQISNFITIYKNELSNRAMKRKPEDLDRDLDQLINVD
jgi:hypothetical protein